MSFLLHTCTHTLTVIDECTLGPGIRISALPGFSGSELSARLRHHGMTHLILGTVTYDKDVCETSRDHDAVLSEWESWQALDVREAAIRFVTRPMPERSEGRRQCRNDKLYSYRIRSRYTLRKIVFCSLQGHHFNGFVPAADVCVAGGETLFSMCS
jgi:hypothetical protein